MKVTIKTLQRTEHLVELAEEATVAAAKDAVSGILTGNPASNRLRLIHGGRILGNDELRLSDLGIKDGDHMVVMVSPPKATPSPATAAATTTSAALPANAANQTSTVSHADAGSALLTGPEYDAAVANIEAMGFARADIVAAMRASFNNPDRAVQYLMQGIPAPDDDDNNSEEDREAEAEDAEENPLAFLRQDPQFRQLRAAIQENPSMLPPLLQQIRQVNPQLHALLEQHRESFIQMMQEANDDGEDPAEARIEVTEEERAAIERLLQLGFDQAAVIEAFFACDKNEELAANYLFEHHADDASN